MADGAVLGQELQTARRRRLDAVGCANLSAGHRRNLFLDRTFEVNFNTPRLIVLSDAVV